MTCLCPLWFGKHPKSHSRTIITWHCCSGQPFDPDMALLSRRVSQYNRHLECLSCQLDIKHSLRSRLGWDKIKHLEMQIINTGRSVSFVPIFWHSPSVASVHLQNLYLAFGIFLKTTKANTSNCLTCLLTSRGTLGGTALQVGPQGSSSSLIGPSSLSWPLLLIWLIIWVLICTSTASCMTCYQFCWCIWLTGCGVSIMCVTRPVQAVQWFWLYL